MPSTCDLKNTHHLKNIFFFHHVQLFFVKFYKLFNDHIPRNDNQQQATVETEMLQYVTEHITITISCTEFSTGRAVLIYVLRLGSQSNK